MSTATDDYIDSQQPAIKLDDLLHILRRRIWYFVIPAILVFAAAVVYALTRPDEYRSQATILIEQQQIPTDLVGATVTTYADERIQSISQRIMTTANLSKVVEKFNLFPDRGENASLFPLVQNMRRRINLQMVSADIGGSRGRGKGASIAFNLGFEDQSPMLAKDVTDELVSLFLNENLRKRREAARETTEFLDTEADRLAVLISELEGEIATFKEQYGDSLPEMQSVNAQMQQRVDQEIQRSELDERLLQERIVYLESELAQTSQWGSDDSAAFGGQSPSDRLIELEGQLAAESIRLRESHPDIINLQREIDRLKLLTGEMDVAGLERSLRTAQLALDELQKKGLADGHPEVRNKKRYVRSLEERLTVVRAAPEVTNGGRPENPVYVQLAAKLESAISELNFLRDNRAKLKQDAIDYQQRISQGPKIEQEYRALTRDYDNTVAKYQEIRSKQLQAEMGETLEAESKGERFELIEPAVVPLEPFKPNRMRIILVGFILGLGMGGGLVYLRQMLDNTVYGAQDVMAITGAPPMVMVPHFNSEVQAAADRRGWALAAYGLGALALIGIGVFYFMVKPLGS